MYVLDQDPVELLSFEIKDFRGIKELKCVLSPKITVLAGRNEAGKTSILQALEALNPDWELQETDKPQNIQDKSNFKLQCNFKINDDEKNFCLTESNLKLDIKSNELIIERSGENPLSYVVAGEFSDSVIERIDSRKERVHELVDQFTILNKILEENGVPQRVTDVDNFKPKNESITQAQNELNSMMPWIQKNKPAIATEVENRITTCNESLTELSDAIETIQNFLNNVKDMVPKVVYFSSFNDVLPSEIDLAELIDQDTLKSQKRIVDDLVSLSDLDRTLFSEANKIGRANLANKASKISSDEFEKHWDQGPIEISFRAEGDSVLFFVQDKGNDTLLQPNQRSQGLQWYLAFFLRLTAEGKTNNIILIDEPGLYLHATAQQNVLKSLEELSENNTIIFSTHSPYLIDPQKLGRLRLVKRDEKTEKIQISDFNKEADIETLTPIITAIGLDITKGLAFPNKKNIIVEGVSDYFYIQGVLNYLKNKQNYTFGKDIAFIPCVGNTKVGTVASLLHGYGLNYKILLDMKGTEKTKNALLRDGVNENRIISVGKKETDSIEDLFDKADQTKYELLAKEPSKKIISRNFYDKITDKKNKSILSPNTVKKFTNLLNEIQKQT